MRNERRWTRLREDLSNKKDFLSVGNIFHHSQVGKTLLSLGVEWTQGSQRCRRRLFTRARRFNGRKLIEDSNRTRHDYLLVLTHQWGSRKGSQPLILDSLGMNWLGEITNMVTERRKLGAKIRYIILSASVMPMPEFASHPRILPSDLAKERPRPRTWERLTRR